MAEFLYKAQNSQGNNFEGTLEAKDKAEAESLLLRRRLTIVSLKKKPKEIRNRRKLRQVLLAAAACAAILILGLVLLFRVRRVEVVGNDHYTDAEITEISLREG